MSMRNQLIDAARALDDYISDAELPAEDWYGKVEHAVTIDDADILTDEMRNRLQMLFKGLPLWNVIVLFQHGPMPAQIQGKNPKMVTRLVNDGLNNQQIDFISIKVLGRVE